MESAIYKNNPAEVIETFGFDPETGFARLGLHLDRCARTCDLMGRAFDRASALQSLGEAVADRAVRVRMCVDATGQIAVSVADLGQPCTQFRVRVAQDRLNADDPWLRVKTTNRDRYDTDRAQLPDGVDELIYLNNRNEVCEGTITNVFARQGARWVTPVLRSGLLPGVLRQDMLDAGTAVEGVLHMDDLHRADALAVGNSLRGLIPAVLVP